MTGLTPLIIAQLANGFAFGIILALIAVGLSIIFGLMSLVNFAHGAFYAFGAYIAYTVLSFGGAHWLALIAAPMVVMLVGFGCEYFLFRRLYGKDPSLSLLLTFGIMLALIQVIRLIWGVSWYPFKIPDALQGAIFVGATNISIYRIFVIALGLILFAVLWLFLKKTSIGLTIRAAIDKRSMARALGINVSAIFTLVFGIGVAFAGLAGAMAAPLVTVFPEMGTTILVESFVVVVIGGMGSIRGSLIAGIIVGEIMAITSLFYPEMTQAAVYLFMAIFLLFKPTGVFGNKL
jgi:branched-chain amino acid transport system permease protein